MRLATITLSAERFVTSVPTASVVPSFKFDSLSNATTRAAMSESLFSRIAMDGARSERAGSVFQQNSDFTLAQSSFPASDAVALVASVARTVSADVTVARVIGSMSECPHFVSGSRGHLSISDISTVRPAEVKTLLLYGGVAERVKGGDRIVFAK